MKVVVANPPAYLYNDNKRFLQAGGRWSCSVPVAKGAKSRLLEGCLPYPFWLGYACALLKRDSIAMVKGVDASALGWDQVDFLDFVAWETPDLLFVEVPTVSFNVVMRLLKEVKMKHNSCQVAVGGAHISALTEECLRLYPFIDYALVGEYELALLHLVNHGSVEPVVLSRPVNDLDFLPYPDRTDFPITYYNDWALVGLPVASMQSSRGCQGNCNFCVERQIMYHSGLYRARRPEKVVEEMLFVRDKYRPKQFYFDDQTMTCQPKHITGLCQEMLRQHVDVPWTCMADVSVSGFTPALMSEAGCVGMKFGVETINSDVLRETGKTFVNRRRVEDFVKTCKRLKIWTHATYAFGLLGDSKESLRDTIDFALKLDSDSLQFSFAVPFPGTPFFDVLKQNGWLSTLDWSCYDGANTAIPNYPCLSSREIMELRSLAIAEYRKKAWSRAVKHPKRYLKIVCDKVLAT